MELNKKTHVQIQQFEEACQRLAEAIAQPKDEFTRDSVIQRFEFCFEMAWKLLQSVLLFMGKECASPRQCIRLASQNNLLDSAEKWLSYQDARNLKPWNLSTPPNN
jgi:nucleotidyltransferase substrate binding protein (TIGR01987 family)